MSDYELWLPTLNPPFGGQARLRVALAQRARHPIREYRWRLAAATACVSILTAFAVPLMSQGHEARRVADAVEAVEAVFNAPLPSLRVENGAAIAVLETEQIRIYWVASKSPMPDVPERPK